MLNIAYKIISNILEERLRAFVNQVVGDYQAGFKTGKGITDQIFIIRQSLEKTQENKITTFHLFIDFKPVFGKPIEVINLVKATMASVRNMVRI